MPDFRVEIRARLAELQLSPVREAEIVEELSQHLEQEYERALSCGASDDEARRQVLEQLNASDLLGRELKRRGASNIGQADRIGIGKEDQHLCRSAARSALRPAHAGEESRVHEHCCYCPRIGHRCKQRNFQCGRRRAVAAPPVQEP